MKTTLAALCLAITVCNPSEILCQATARVSAPPSSWADHLRRSTISFGRIANVKGKSAFEAIGTGVLVGHNLGQNHWIVVIATAKHVLDDPDEKWHPSEIQIRLAAEEQHPLADDNGYRLPLIDSHGKRLWIAPEDGSDVAIIQIMPDFYSRLPSETLTDLIPDDALATDNDVFEGNHVVIFGFPGDVSALMGENSLVRAVMRSGSISWTDPTQPNQAFMIDANIMPGNSGSPVFQTPDGTNRAGGAEFGRRVVLLGIVTDTLANKYVDAIGGLGRVEPASKIGNLLRETYR